MSSIFEVPREGFFRPMTCLLRGFLAAGFSVLFISVAIRAPMQNDVSAGALFARSQRTPPYQIISAGTPMRAGSRASRALRVPYPASRPSWGIQGSLMYAFRTSAGAPYPEGRSCVDGPRRVLLFEGPPSGCVHSPAEGTRLRPCLKVFGSPATAKAS